MFYWVLNRLWFFFFENISLSFGVKYCRRCCLLKLSFKYYLFKSYCYTPINLEEQCKQLLYKIRQNDCSVSSPVIVFSFSFLLFSVKCFKIIILDNLIFCQCETTYLRSTCSKLAITAQKLIQDSRRYLRWSALEQQLTTFSRLQNPPSQMFCGSLRYLSET